MMLGDGNAGEPVTSESDWTHLDMSDFNTNDARASEPEGPWVTDEQAQRMSWAMLLGRWMAFAQSAVALKDHPQGRQLFDSVPQLIMLQAVWHALGQLHALPEDQRALGLDRAGVLIDRCERELVDRYSQALPPQIRELIDDAREAYQRASQAGAT